MSTLRRLDRTLRPQPQLPEKAVQFGTGAFLRGFIDYFLDVANDAGLFGGQVVMVGSTGSGRDRLLNEQDGLYTLWIRGVQNGKRRNDYRLISSVSRALSAAHEWEEVLACARNPQIEYIFSNTTETGIALDESDRPTSLPPRSFPGKLTRFLHERATHFDYASDQGVVIIPCELIEDNGEQLKQIVLTLGEGWGYGQPFSDWINQSVPFCNTLVDRIVPGEPDYNALLEARKDLDYADEMLTVCEPYKLFAIEADESVAKRVRFKDADPSIIVTDDISAYRLRKVRLLNGAHTIMVPLALLAGCRTVAEAVADKHVGGYLRRVLFNELVPSLAVEGARDFASAVLDRFSNPYIRHELIDITLQQTTKLRVRVIPALLDFVKRKRRVPTGITLGFAAYLAYMGSDQRDGRTDDAAARVKEHLRTASTAQEMVNRVGSDQTLWGVDLTKVPDFTDLLANMLDTITRHGARQMLEFSTMESEPAR